MRRAQRAAAARQATGRRTALVHRVAGLLLDYPSAELLTLLPTARAALAELPASDAEPLRGVIDHLEGADPTRLQAQYVATFDLQRRCALYLTYYAYGDTRKRGVALVEIKQAYRRAGFEPADAELPDHLGVLLEFASGGDQAQEAGLRLLLEHRAGLELLRLALVDSGSPWAGALVAVCATLPPLEGDEREAVARVAAQGPPGEDVGLEPFAPPSYLPPVSPSRTAAASPAAPRTPVPVPFPTSGARR